MRSSTAIAKIPFFLFSAIMLYLILIFIGSSLSIVPIPQLIPYQDKIEHFTEYCILGIILFLNYKLGRRINKAISMIVLLSWPVLDEFHQSFVPMRDVSVFDAIADYVGMFAAVLSLHLLFNSLKSKKDVK